MQSDSVRDKSAHRTLCLDLVSLRLAVGSLGERAAPAWWQSGFLGGNAAAFLDPVFGAKRLSAQ